jgi:hypothetical protein
MLKLFVNVLRGVLHHVSTGVLKKFEFFYFKLYVFNHFKNKI